jgi:membrane-bound lytic murein transglycosylase B
VGRPLLAAVNLVETQFGRLRNESVSGARGPMQFMPATWAAYGLGGDVRSPRDAILGAANYLHANGAPRDEARALLHYNPSRAYVSAVRRYARRMRRDPRAFYVYYAWQVYVGGKRLSGPGLG